MIRRLSRLAILVAAMVIPMAPAAAGGGCHPAPGAKMTTSSKSSVTIDQCAFGTTVTYAEPGDTVTWSNEDYVPHSVTGAALAWGTEKFLSKGDSVSYTFDEEGVFPYYCALHPTMVGAVVVGDGKGAARAAGIAAAAAELPPAEPAPAPSDGGTSPLLIALVAAAALAAVAVTARYGLTRRGGAAASQG
jgi:plastocyanin